MTTATSTLALVPLRERAMLATLSVRCWKGHKTDRAVTNQVHAQHRANRSAGRYLKYCLDPADLAEIVAAQGKARAALYALTSPWGDQQVRVLPVANFERLRELADQAAIETREAADRLAARWPEIIARRAAAMNGLFDPRDYPDASAIADRYSVRLAFYEIPDSNDFRVALDREQLAAAQAAVESDVARAIESVKRDIFARMVRPVQKMVERLSAFEIQTDPDSGKQKVIAPFRDTLVNNLRELVAELPKLNICDDPQVVDMLNKLESLCEHDAQELRDSKALRLHVSENAATIAQDVANILDSFGWSEESASDSMAA
jgi:hypothetical protein